MTTSHLRVTAPASSPAIPAPEAIEQARKLFGDARNAYIDLLQMFGSHRLLSMLRSQEKLNVQRLRFMRDEAQRMAERALAVVSALDACVDVCERAERRAADA